MSYDLHKRYGSNHVNHKSITTHPSSTKNNETANIINSISLIINSLSSINDQLAINPLKFRVPPSAFSKTFAFDNSSHLNTDTTICKQDSKVHKRGFSYNINNNKSELGTEEDPLINLKIPQEQYKNNSIKKKDDMNFSEITRLNLSIIMTNQNKNETINGIGNRTQNFGLDTNSEKSDKKSVNANLSEIRLNDQLNIHIGKSRTPSISLNPMDQKQINHISPVKKRNPMIFPFAIQKNQTDHLNTKDIELPKDPKRDFNSLENNLINSFEINKKPIDSKGSKYEEHLGNNTKIFSLEKNMQNSNIFMMESTYPKTRLTSSSSPESTRFINNRLKKLISFGFIKKFHNCHGKIPQNKQQSNSLFETNKNEINKNLRFLQDPQGKRQYSRRKFERDKEKDTCRSFVKSSLDSNENFLELSLVSNHSKDFINPNESINPLNLPKNLDLKYNSPQTKSKCVNIVTLAMKDNFIFGKNSSTHNLIKYKKNIAPSKYFKIQSNEKSDALIDIHSRISKSILNKSKLNETLLPKIYSQKNGMNQEQISITPQITKQEDLNNNNEKEIPSELAKKSSSKCQIAKIERQDDQQNLINLRKRRSSDKKCKIRDIMLDDMMDSKLDGWYAGDDFIDP